MDSESNIQGAGWVPTPAVPAPYGRTCVNCVKAKCKCLTRNGSTSCERCVRLGRDCRPSDTTRRRKKTTATASLEAKVDGILSLLQSVNETATRVNGIRVASTTHGNTIVNGDQSAAGQSKIVNERRDIVDANSLDSTPSFLATTPQTTESNAAGSAPSELVVNGGETFGSPGYSVYAFPLDEADRFLTDFRTQKLPNFGFIHIPASITAQRLREERPFLFLTIMAVSSKSSSQRQSLGQEIKQTIAKEMLVENEGNFDILLGLLVFLTWGYDQFVKTPLSSRFTHLAMVMVFDLRLNKPPRKDPATIFHDGLNESNKEEGPVANRPLEERRAVLGCFVLSSTVSWYFAKIDPLRWTPYMEECLQLLSSEQECPTDEIFAHQVRLHLIAANAIQATSNEAGSDRWGAPRASLPFYLKALRSQLVSAKADLSIEARNNHNIIISMHYAELCINALALCKDPLISNTAGYERLDCLSQCLDSIKSWFELFFAIPTSEWISISFQLLTQLAHVVVILHRISAREDPAWDLALVRSTVDIMLILDRLTTTFRSLAEGCGEGPNMGVFGKMAFVFEWVKSWPRSKIFADPKGVNDSNAFRMQSAEETIDVAMQDMPPMMDDVLLSEVLGSWSYDFY